MNNDHILSDKRFRIHLSYRTFLQEKKNRVVYIIILINSIFIPYLCYKYLTSTKIQYTKYNRITYPDKTSSLDVGSMLHSIVIQKKKITFDIYYYNDVVTVKRLLLKYLNSARKKICKISNL